MTKSERESDPGKQEQPEDERVEKWLRDFVDRRLRDFEARGEEAVREMLDAGHLVGVERQAALGWLAFKRRKAAHRIQRLEWLLWSTLLAAIVAAIAAVLGLFLHP